jgi:oxysterol-binding protein-related protein 9/10/11
VNETAPAIDSPKKAPPQTPPDPMAPSEKSDPVRVSYLTEQTSHHPPISAYYADCPERGVYARGYDHINVKFTGTSIRVSSATYNKGIYVNIVPREEEYRLTHPAAYLCGLVRTSLYISVSDTCYVYCPKTRLKVIMEYEEGWMSSGNKMTAVIFRYDPDKDKYSKIKEVPDKEVLVRLEGVWQDAIYYWIPGSDGKPNKPPADKQLLIDLAPLMPVPKICPPPEEQLPNESRRMWKDLTQALQEKRYSDANRIKQDIEQRQRDKAAERQKNDVTWKPRFFAEVTDDAGRPHLSAEGQNLLAGMQKKDFKLAEAEVLAA